MEGRDHEVVGAGAGEWRPKDWSGFPLNWGHREIKNGLSQGTKLFPGLKINAQDTLSPQGKVAPGKLTSLGVEGSWFQALTPVCHDRGGDKHRGKPFCVWCGPVV